MNRRAWVWVALAGFLLVSVGVIWRRSVGHAESRRLQELQRREDALRNEQLKLEGEIRAASSRAQLAPLVERRLGMRVPPASNVILLKRSPAKNDSQ